MRNFCKKLAKEVGLDMEKFEQDRKNPAFQKQLKEDRQLGRKAGVRGVPSLFINGQPVKDRSLEGMSAMVDAELKNIVNSAGFNDTACRCSPVG